MPAYRSAEDARLAARAEEPAAAGLDRLSATAGGDRERVRALPGETC